MRTIEVNVYEFSELSKEVQAKVLNKYRDINVDHDWWEFIECELKDLGIELVEFDTYRRIIKLDFVADLETIAHNIMNDHSAICDTHKVAVTFLEDKDTEEFMYDLKTCYMDSLCGEYEGLISDELVKETIECNEYEFDQYGNLI
jgi:hypothetical protein